MVLGLKTKNRNGSSVQLDYVIDLVEVKPWPPSQSLRSLRSALIRWEHGDKNSGSTKTVVPSIVSGSGVGDGKIEFNEAFRLPVTLSRDMSSKAGNSDAFLKNCMEFNLYEPRREKTVRGQLLATAIVDFAEYGIVKRSLAISVPMNCKRTVGNTAQPMLFLNIRTVEKNIHVRSSSRDSLLREGSMDRNCSESVSALMNQEYANEAETASITDDDVSSQSSMAAASSTSGSNGSSTPQRENGSETVCGSSRNVKDQEVLVQDKGAAESVSETHNSLDASSRNSSPADLYSELEKARATFSNLRDSSFTRIPRKAESYGVQPLWSSIADDGTNEELNTNSRNNPTVNLHEKVLQKAAVGKNDTIGNARENMLPELAVNVSKADGEVGSTKAIESQVFAVDDEQSCIEVTDLDESQSGRESQLIGDLRSNMLCAAKLKNVKSASSQLGSGFNNGSVRTSKSLEKAKGVTVPGQNGGRILTSNERKDVSKVQHLEQRIQILESELREAAAIEVGLYSIVAEHGSSINKVLAPARRLSRLYLHACKENALSRRASSARSIVSGLILVAKACGNDVPRLTFWLSNCIVLRVIICKTFEKEEVALSAGQSIKKDVRNVEKGDNESSLKDSSVPATSNGLEDPCMVISVLEKVESWIFSRIIESVWWQTLAPYMQSTAAKAIVRVVNSESHTTGQTTSGSCDQGQANSSLELWKRAFTEACQRICPVRGAGHDCVCLPVLSRLVMDQCAARLDVAMFNAILRESADQGPTDPISDPISDARVLPIPSGKASFGAGAQLKTAIGNWSRWLTNLFGVDNNGSFGDEDEQSKDYDTSFKSFHLLSALSDLMMLPKDLLLSNTIRKEVCPTFGAPLIMRILETFVPDEFCPDPIPEVVLEAIGSEDSFESSEDCLISLPCAASPIVYHPPSASLIGCILGDGGSQVHFSCSGLRKSNTSDDELDDLDSPLTTIIDSSWSSAVPTKPGWTLKHRNAIRYQLLREVWRNSK